MVSLIVLSVLCLSSIITITASNIPKKNATERAMPLMASGFISYRFSFWDRRIEDMGHRRKMNVKATVGLNFNQLTKPMRGHPLLQIAAQLMHTWYFLSHSAVLDTGVSGCFHTNVDTKPLSWRLFHFPKYSHIFLSLCEVYL